MSYRWEEIEEDIRAEVTVMDDTEAKERLAVQMQEVRDRRQRLRDEAASATATIEIETASNPQSKMQVERHGDWLCIRHTAGGDWENADYVWLRDAEAKRVAQALSDLAY